MRTKSLEVDYCGMLVMRFEKIERNIVVILLSKVDGLGCEGDQGFKR